jgi:MazG family protein
MVSRKKIKVNPHARKIGKAVEKLANVMYTLRSEGGCPWDRAQTLQDLRQYVLEEAYEVLQALDQNNLHALKEELGDLMFQVVFLSQMMQETEEFNLADVIAHVTHKMLTRHPHVFGDQNAESPEQALANWEAMKDQAKAQQKGVNRSILDGLPIHLPALQQALMISSKVVRVGFEWETESDVWKKLDEEIQEFHEAASKEQKAEEMGDILFTIVNIARKNGIHPEDALRTSNEKFRDRFTKLERKIYEQGKQLQDVNLAEMDKIWEEIKKQKGDEGEGGDQPILK